MDASLRYIAERRRYPERPHKSWSLYTYQHLIDHDFMLADQQWHLDPELSGCVVARVGNYPNRSRRWWRAMACGLSCPC